ncbi:putative cytochrome P450 [Dothidotthia symphoricarpi CBS 119687]|uniref:Putative cytochrome P450 n=1 Tax=Dothidotthia symphoricarpi CBS 119687 TaxID=1392245 RepID=A0A6A6ASA0_9PLEO|nr:putative cytochrome P450 [Dothidotthia symphoricarpi CBS 119687]KAF2134819.1 putative cytochrome P450 [Dothidotthia symphoricarpi CBS 119687]
MVSYFSLIFLAAFGTLFGVVSFFVYLFTPPRNFPTNIPTIPFYYALLPLFKDVDQAELYRQYMMEPLEKYGAVKLFFGGRWNILVRKPAYIAEVFKHEDIYAKSGNNVKIPHTLIAEYTGENIISAHGAKWKLYQSVIKPALQADQDSTPIWSNARILRDIFLGDANKAAGSGVPIYAPLHRLAVANFSEVLYTSSFETLQRPDAPLHKMQSQMKPLIFNPIFLNFPFLDHLPLKARQIGRVLNKQFRHTLLTSIAKGHNHVCDSNDPKSLACRLLGSHNDGLLTEKDLNDNIAGTFIAGHENPQIALMSLMYLLGAHPEVQEAVRKEVGTLFPADAPADYEPSYANIHDLPYLTAVVYEGLRMFPPISQLINRCTTTPVVLGNHIPIPAGVYVGYNAYSTNRDVEFWGMDSDDFKPARWGKNMDEINHLYRRANSKGAYISFHGGKRACLGQKFALQQLRITIVELVRGCKWTVDEEWDGHMTPAGPLYPKALTMKFQALGNVTTSVFSEKI